MPIVTNGRVIYIAHPTGYYQPGVHTKYVEEQIDTDTVPLNGGVLVKTLAISSDPYMRHRMRDASIPLFAPALIIGQPLDNFSVGQVVRSEDPQFVPGDYVAGYFTFENYSVHPGSPDAQHLFKHCVKIPKIEGLPISTFVGTLGLPGKTAYTGLTVHGKEKIKNSKALFVSGGAGPVGTFVIEYAKIMNPNLKVIASAGSAEKVEIMKKVGADVAFNYKKQDTNAVLKEHGPIDVYWDNVAGPTLDAALLNMNMFGLVIACGAMSGLSAADQGIIRHFEKVFEKSITVNGFLYGFGEAAQKALVEFDKEIPPLLAAGKITSREQRYVGLKNAEQALADVHLGTNHGKAVIIVAEDD